MARTSGVHGDSYVHFERDKAGVAYAVEVVTVDAWDDVLAEAPAVELADVRVVRPLRGRAPSELPGWLRVEVTPLRVAKARPAYGRAAAAAGAPAVAAASWRWSPHFRQPGPGAPEFLAAGAAALPAEPERGVARTDQVVLGGGRPPQFTTARAAVGGVRAADRAHGAGARGVAGAGPAAAGDHGSGPRWDREGAGR